MANLRNLLLLPSFLVEFRRSLLRTRWRHDHTLLRDHTRFVVLRITREVGGECKVLRGSL